MDCGPRQIHLIFILTWLFQVRDNSQTLIRTCWLKEKNICRNPPEVAWVRTPSLPILIYINQHILDMSGPLMILWNKLRKARVWSLESKVDMTVDISVDCRLSSLASLCINQSWPTRLLLWSPRICEACEAIPSGLPTLGCSNWAYVKATCKHSGH